MSRRSGRNRPLWRIVQDRMGFRRGARVLEFVMLWGVCHAELEREPANVEEFVDWWGDDALSNATGYRMQALFRECFEHEGFETPSDLFEALDVVPGEFSVGTLRAASLA